MANKRFNQQVAQPRMGKMGGGMMNKRSMMKDGSTPRKSIEKMLAEDELKKRKRRLGQTGADILKKSPKTGKGGGADSGKMGELKSKLTVAGMKAKDVIGKSTGGLTKEQIEKLKEFFDRNKDKFGPKGNKEKFMKPLRRLKPEVKPMRNLKKGGKALKPVDKEKNPGLAKLPTKVRNKMGFMKKGGRVKKFGGGKK